MTARRPPTLRTAYGRRYRVHLDPAADSWRDPHLHVIPTRTGEVYPHSATHAGVEVHSNRRAALATLRQSRYPLLLDGDDVKTYLIPWSDLPAILPALRPYKRRQVSEEQRQQMSDRLASYRFPRHAAADERSTARESTQTASADPEAVSTVTSQEKPL